MKNLKFILGGTILCSSLSFGQTNVIALKSHAGNVDELLKEKDNFGDHPGMWLGNVDSVKFIPEEKIVIEYKTSHYNKESYGDTTNYKNQDDKTIQEHLKAIRFNNWYPEKTKFIGFPAEIEKMAEEKRAVKQNTIPFWLVLSLLGLGGVLAGRKVD